MTETNEWTHLNFLRSELITVDIDGEFCSIVDDIWMDIDSLFEDWFGPSRIEISPEGILTPITIHCIQMRGELKGIIRWENKEMVRKHVFEAWRMEGMEKGEDQLLPQQMITCGWSEQTNDENNPLRRGTEGGERGEGEGRGSMDKREKLDLIHTPIPCQRRSWFRRRERREKEHDSNLPPFQSNLFQNRRQLDTMSGMEPIQ